MLNCLHFKIPYKLFILIAIFKSFLRQKYNLTKHKKLHEHKKYLCLNCPKAFHYKYNLDAHMKSCIELL